MWVKLKSGTYLNLENHHMMGVREQTRPQAYEQGKWVVWANAGLGQPAHTLEEGYKDRNEAQGALDEFMAEREVVSISPPVKDEEKAEDEQEEGK